MLLPHHPSAFKPLAPPPGIPIAPGLSHYLQDPMLHPYACAREKYMVGPACVVHTAPPEAVSGAPPRCCRGRRDQRGHIANPHTTAHTPNACANRCARREPRDVYTAGPARVAQNWFPGSRFRDAAAPDEREHPEGVAHTPTEEIVPRKNSGRCGAGCWIRAHGLERGRYGSWQVTSPNWGGWCGRYREEFSTDLGPGQVRPAQEAPTRQRVGYAVGQRHNGLPPKSTPSPVYWTPSVQTGWMSAAACARS